MKWMLVPVLALTLSTPTLADDSLEAMASGNAAIRSSALQRVVKKIIVKNLQKSIDASNSLSGITINSGSSDHSLNIPENPMMNQIMNALGIKDHVKIGVSPIETSINFGPESLKIKIVKQGPEVFKLLAHWEISQLKARCHYLNINVPKGAFDREFTIKSAPVKIGLKKDAGPLTADLSVLVRLSENGATFDLGSFKTNLDAKSNLLKIQLGKLTIDGNPLELEVISNGKSLKTDELTVRKEFQKFEPQLMKIVEKKLSQKIHQEFESIAGKLSEVKPVKLTFDTNQIMDSYSLKTDVVRSVLKDISGSFLFSYFQEVENQNLYVTQISSDICIGNSCVNSVSLPKQMTTDDTAKMGTDDAGMIVYESWLKNLINSDSFQKRIFDYYNSSIKTPGVSLGSQGVKIHLNQWRNSIAAVLNLKIDIKKTTNTGFFDYLKKQLADLWENAVGSGEYVYVPVEINFEFQPITVDSSGRHILKVLTKMPFLSNGQIINTYNYWNNLSSMNATIREQLLNCVEAEIAKSVPAEMSINLDDPIKTDDFNFYINRVSITKNKGLLVSGAIE